MTLREYLTNLSKFAEQNPDTLDLEVVKGCVAGVIAVPIDELPVKGVYRDYDFNVNGDANAVCVC